MHRWDPGEYGKSSSAQQKWARDLISKIDLIGDERILDIGCGDGKITVELASLVKDGSVTGIDCSSEMIRFAHTRFPRSRYPNLIFQIGDAQELKFKEEFDLVVSFACLHWDPDHLSVLRGIKRCLKKPGRAVLQFGGRGNAAAVIETADKVISGDRWSRYFEGFVFPYSFLGPEEYRGWLERAGLKEIRVELVPKDMVQAGTQGLASWIRTTWLPYIERVPTDLRMDITDEIADEYVRAYPPDDRGQVHVQMIRLEVVAENE